MAIEQTFTSNGSTKVFTISEFDFLRTSDIKVFIDPTGGTAKTLVTENTGAVAGQYTINQTAKTITFISSNIQGSLQTNDGSGNAGAPLAGVVTAQRITAVDTPINTFQAGSSITADDLNDSLNQLRFNINEYGTLTNSGSLSDSDKGDITVSNSGNTWTIDNSVVNNAKIANDSVDGSKLTDNIDIAGTLDVTGATTLDSTLGVAGNFSVNTNKFTVAGSDGDTNIAGNLNVDGDTTLDSTTMNGTLVVHGLAYVDNIKFNGNEIDTVSGELTISCHGSTVTIDDNTTISGTLGVTGALAANGGITVDTDKFTVADSTGNTTIAGTLTTAAQKAVTVGGPLILSKVSKDVTGLSTLALHASDNTVSNILNAAYLELSSSSGAVTLATITGGTAGQVLYITATGSHDITLTNVSDTTANGFVIGGGDATYTLNATNKDTIIVIYNGSQWIKVGGGVN